MIRWRTLALDLLCDMVGGILYAVGIYTFAKMANFAPGGLSGLALLMNYLWDLPIGLTTMAMNIPLVVLANEYSASASELLIGGIQDYELGTFIGTTTYGKGVVQSFIPMSDGESVMKLTTDRYLTPKERSIQDVGCTPDIELEPSEELAANPILMGTEKDNQLEAALEHLEGQIQ